MYSERFRGSVLPFLLLAYPVTFLFFQGGQFCDPLCFEPTPVAAFRLVVILLVVAAVAGVARGKSGLDAEEDTRKPVRWLLSPAPSASVGLLAVFALFVLFLALDAMTLYEPLWKPVVLPASFVLYFPVWVLYMGSFPLAVLFSVLGIEFSRVVTLVVRGVVVGFGFPLSALFQSLALSAAVDVLRSRSE